jgi:hypothetical protein
MDNDVGASSLGDEISASCDSAEPPLYRGRTKGFGRQRGVCT